MNTRDEFRNVSVTEAGVVDTRYGVSQPVASRRLNAGWLVTGQLADATGDFVCLVFVFGHLLMFSWVCT